MTGNKKNVLTAVDCGGCCRRVVNGLGIGTGRGWCEVVVCVMWLCVMWHVAVMCEIMMCVV